MGETEQRRGTFRVGLDHPVLVRRGGSGAVHARLRDLSIDGARLMGDLELRLGEPISVALSLDGDGLELSGRVVRVGDLGAGIRFDALKPVEESRIARFLTEQQRRRGRPRA